MENVDHLVLSGGALKGIAFLGTLECLQRRQSLKLDRLKVLVGASVGAMISSLISIGWTSAQIFKVVFDTDIAELAQPEIGKLLTHYGLDSGNGVINKMKELFRIKGVDPNITLKQHFDYTGKRLVITVSCLGKGVRYFDYTNEPDLSVLSAVRMSISIPGYFTAVRYKGDFYVDGGVLDNVPIAFLANVDPERIVVIRTTFKPYQQPTPTEDTPETFLWLLWLTTAREMERLRLESTTTTRDIHRRSTIHIDVSPSASPIAPTQMEKKTLLRDGYKAAIAFLESERWVEQRINRLPYGAMRRVWQQVHQRSFGSVLDAIRRDEDEDADQA